MDVDRTPFTENDLAGDEEVTGYATSSGRGQTAPPPMTRDRLDDVSITNPDEFEAVLAEIIERALDADVDVRGAWEFQTPGSTHDWEVEIVELAKDSDRAAE